MRKLLYLNNFEAPYRVPFFNRIAEKYDMTLALSHRPESQVERNAKWFVETKRNYKVQYLNTIELKGKKIGFEVLKMIKNYDLIFMDMYSNPTNALAIIWMNLRRIPFVMSVDGMLKREGESRIKKWIKGYFLKSPRLILSPSDYTDECLQGYGVKKERLIRYHFSSLEEPDILSRIRTKEERRILREELGMTEEKILLSVGRFTYEAGYGKGYDTIMQMVEKLKDSSCGDNAAPIGIYIVGDEPTEEFVKWKREKGLDSVHFVGFKTKEELAKFYDAADAFVIASRGDVWGLVVNEAMAHGLPVISSDRCLGGLDLVQEGVNGAIFKTGDSEDLLAKVRMVFDGEITLEEQGKRSLDIIQEYTIEKMADIHLKVFDEFLS